MSNDKVNNFIQIFNKVVTIFLCLIAIVTPLIVSMISGTLNETMVKVAMITSGIAAILLCIFIKTFKKRSITLTAVIILIIIACVFVTNIDDTHAYQSYKKAPTTNISSKVFRHDGAYNLWQRAAMHNDVNCLIGGGNYYLNEGLNIMPKPDAQGTTVIYKNNKIASSNEKWSYVNVNEQNIYYRNDSNRDIFVFDIENHNNTKIYSGNIGEMVVYNGRIYFIDLNDSNNLKSISLGGSSKMIVVKKNIHEFLIYGNSCVFLSNDNKLYYKNIHKNYPSIKIMSKCDKFYFNGKIISQVENKIIGYDISSGKSTLLYNGSDSLKLVGAYDNGYFIMDKDGLYQCSMNNKMQKKIVSAATNSHYMTSILYKDGAINLLDYSLKTVNTEKYLE